MTGYGPSSSSLSNPNSLLAWNVTHAFTLNNSTDTYVEYDVNGWSYTGWNVVKIANGSNYILVDTFDLYGIINLNREDLEWRDENDTTVLSVRLGDLISPGHYYAEHGTHLVMPISVLDSIYNGGTGPVGFSDINNLHFVLRNGKGTLTIQIGFDESAHLLPRTALEDEGIYLSLQQDFSDRRTSINLLAFIGGLFSFEPPGVPYPVSTIVSGIWYGCVAALSYVIFTIVRSLIPFLGGGD